MPLSAVWIPLFFHQKNEKTERNKTMKKTSILLLALTVLLCTLQLSVAAEATTVTVTISVAGKTTLHAMEVTVTDADGDGALTVSDALYAAHQAAFEGGAEAGYNAYIHKDYGLSLGKLWGDTSGNFGYYVNHASAWGLSDPVKDGDVVDAFVYADGKYFSDQYTFFETSVEQGVLTLTLWGAGYDADWNPITTPVVGAKIILDGEETEIVTDENGKATLTLAEGEHLLSATAAGKTIVPPVARVNIPKAPVAAGDGGVVMSTVLLVGAFAVVLTVLGRKQGLLQK
jgi:hypothetical protein